MTEPVDLLLDSLERDRRFRALTSGEATTMDLYYLRFKRLVNEPSRLLFGWVVPALPRPTKWSERDLADWRSTGRPGVKYKPHGLSLTAPWSKMRPLVTSWIAGQDLGTAAAAANLPRPRAGHDLALRANAAVAPYVCLLRTSGISLDLARGARGAGSPSNEVPHWAMCLPLLDKSRLWADAEGSLPRFEEIAKTVLDLLGKETGLDFAGSDVHRLGGLELLSGAYDERLQPLVRIEGNNENCEVSVETPQLEVGGEVTVAIDGDSFGDIIDSVVSSRVVERRGPPLLFSLPGDFNGLTVRAWYKPPSASRAQLLYEQRVTFIEEIHISMGLTARAGFIGSPWLERLAQRQDESVRQRAESLQRFARTSYEPIQVGDRNLLGQMRIQARTLARELVPPEHDSAFFSKGWGDTGTLGFFEWLKSKMERTSASRVVLADPYFDAPALEVFARAGDASTQFTVVTCAQAKSEDDDDSAPRTAPRVERIRSAFNLNLRAFRGLAFEVLDLRSREGGSRSLFHDRYLVSFDGANRAIAAYNISNSLQGATKTAPLLVSPVGGKALRELGEYVNRLLAGKPDPSSDVDVVQICTTSTRPTRPSDAPPASWAWLWSRLLGVRVSPASTEAQVLAALEERGITRTSGEHSYAFDAALCRALAGVRVDAVADKDPQAAFEALAWVLARSVDVVTGDLVGVLVEGSPPGWFELVGEATAAAVEDALLSQPESWEEDISIGRRVTDDFGELIDIARDVSRYSPSLDSRPWVLHFGTEILARGERNRLAMVLWGWRADLIAGKPAALRAVARVIGRLLWLPQLRESLLSTPHPLVRAIGSWLFIGDNQGGVHNLNGKLETSELVPAVLCGIREKRMRGTDVDANALLAHLALLLSDAPPLPELRRMLARAGRPIEGSDLLPAHEHLLAPLSQKNETWARQARRLEADLLMSRLAGLSPFGSAPPGHPQSYYHPVDEPLVRVGGQAIASLAADELGSWTEAARACAVRWRRAVQRTFGKSVDHSAWLDGHTRLHWLSSAVAVAVARAQTQRAGAFEWWSEFSDLVDLNALRDCGLSDLASLPTLIDDDAGGS